MRVLLDCDGILGDFVSGCQQWFQSHHGLTYDLESFKSFDLLEATGHVDKQESLDRYMRDTDFCRHMPVYPGAQKFVEDLRAWHEIVVVTSPYSAVENWCHSRIVWLGEHFGIPKHDVIFCKRKELIIGDVLVDDRGENCEAFNASPVTGHKGREAICLDRPWNRSFVNLTRAESYDEVLGIIGVPL